MYRVRYANAYNILGPGGFSHAMQLLITYFIVSLIDKSLGIFIH